MYAGGFFGTTAYISRIGRQNPVLAGFKTPWGVFGALLGGQLSYHLGPAMVDGMRVCVYIYTNVCLYMYTHTHIRII